MQTRYSNDSFIALTVTTLSYRLEEWTIGDIPFLQFSREFVEKSINGCVVCLNEFQEQHIIRVLPICSRGFHLDCIHIWLQTNSNCPHCRTSISGKTQAPFDAIMAPSSSPQNPQLLSGNLMDGDENFVVIELREENDMIFLVERIGKNGRHVSIVGDEAIDVRGKGEGEEFYSAVKRTINLNESEESSNRFQTSFFPARQGRGSRNAVLPLEF